MTDHADEEVDAAIARLGLALGKAVMKEDFEEANELGTVDCRAGAACALPDQRHPGAR